MRSKEDDQKSKKSLIRLAKEGLTSENPSLLGDPVSLKAETADSHPTEDDLGAASVKPETKATTTKQMPSGNGGFNVVGGGNPFGALDRLLSGGKSDAIGDPVQIARTDAVVSEEDLDKEGRGGWKKGSKL